MGGKNAYLAKQRAIQQAYIQASERVTEQLMTDCIVLVLNEEFGFGYERAKRVVDALTAAFTRYHEALDGGPEADYVQEKLDAALRRIIGDKGPFSPFAERYPEIRVTPYGKK